MWKIFHSMMQVSPPLFIGGGPSSWQSSFCNKNRLVLLRESNRLLCLGGQRWDDGGRSRGRGSDHGDDNDDGSRRKVKRPRRNLPNLIYLQNPFRWMRTKLDFQLLKIWDPSFVEADFKRGAKQAVSHLTTLVRNNNSEDIAEIATGNGFAQIVRDMTVSLGDPRIDLLKMRPQDIRRAIPIKVHFIQNGDKRHCFIDMFFVGLRSFDDMEPEEQRGSLLSLYRLLDSKARMHFQNEHKVIFVEIMTRLHRDFTPPVDGDWNFAYYKVAKFDVLAIKIPEEN